MPRHHQPPTLRTASLLNIAQHIDSYWCNGTNAKLLETPRLMYIIGPFDYLSDDLLHQLMQTLVKYKSLRRYHLQLMVHSNVRSLDLGMCQAAANHASVINTIGQRCQKLTHLKLINLRQISAKVLCNLMPNLPVLKSLDLSGTKCNGSVLQAISQANLHLADLNVSRCPIKEEELLFLCNYSGSTSSSLDLRKLSIRGIEISTNAVATLLRCHRNLNILKGPSSVCAALHDMYGETFLPGVHVSPEDCCKLTQVLLSFHGLRPFGGLVAKTYVELLVVYCPYLTKLVFFGAKDDKALSPLSELQHLSSIEIYSDFGDITFQNGIAPLLEKIGPNLLKVSLHFVMGIDLAYLGTLCPNVCKLNISLSIASRHNTALEPAVSQPQPVRGDMPHGCFAKLEKFDLLVCSETPSLPEKTISVVLTAASKIRHLRMTNVDSITDATISAALKCHGFKHLEEVDFENCNSITAGTGWMFLEGEGPLRRLWVPNCKVITLADWESYRKYCKDNNLDVDVFWT